MAEIFRDPRFEKGFRLTDTCAEKRMVGTLRYGKSRFARPRWRLVQWCTKDLLRPGQRCAAEEGWYRWRNESKSFGVQPEWGAISLACDAGREFAAPRRAMQDWPHLLVEQKGLAARCPNLADLSSLTLKTAFCIDRAECRMAPQEIDETLHTAQFQLYFTLQNRNRRSADYGDCIWFGLQFYDWRYDYGEESLCVDGGKETATGLAIYVVDGRKYLSAPVRVGSLVRVEFDLLPELDRAIEKVRAFDGVKSFRRTERGDLKLTSMNLGWELPGTFDVAATVYGLSLQT